MTNETMGRMLNEIMSFIDKLIVLCDSITSHLKSLNDWKILEEELEDEQEIEKAAEDVKKLLSFTENVSTEKQLVGMQNDLINRLNKLSDRAIMEKECKPMKLVLHSDASRIPSVVDQYENLNRLLNEVQARLLMNLLI
uniref:Uncharacterized protein n=1 Tax=Onchocerca volvulus TaxID=6282 RepID=A0A8R1TQT9_ONCVO